MPKSLRNPLKRLATERVEPTDGTDLDNEAAALTEIYRGADPAVDIVAVHGLNGDAFRTFTSQTSGRCWLDDPEMLPKDLPNCRVLTFSYPATVANVLGKTSSDRILQHAQTLVAELVADRELENAVQRPIIFVCHSLGGIIVKRALVYSASRTAQKIEHLRSVFVSTYGVLFMATPHDGTDKAKLASFAQKLVDSCLPNKLVDTSPQLVDALATGSEVLQEITDNFTPLMKRFCLCFFWEQNKTDLVTTYDYVVDQASAAPVLDNTDRAGLPYDHRSICRFTSRTAPGYRIVIAALRRYARESPGVVSQRWSDEESIMLSLRMAEARELQRPSLLAFAGKTV
ncbi:ribonuclease-like protein p/mrp subunit [Podospora aff. communis PSN243]|uniref:Ribonuclease-like protein p/mrp subunit n=1 Tax=Podospora aff. communis PSN243 TaxID=3040156 RepID=A0AAV9GEV4_9PEZI|nr:ribonuclease-like protein p/mrp subunit [Podospora aff. communis PSN243]